MIDASGKTGQLDEGDAHDWIVDRQIVEGATARQ